MAPNKRFGFTLVEVLVVTSIMLVTTGFGIARYNDYTQQRRLDHEAKKLVSVFELASKRAISGDSSAACADFQGVQVAITKTGSYTVRRCCEGACTSAQSTIYTSAQLPNGINIAAPPSDATYLFNKLTQAVTINPPTSQTIILQNTLSSKCLTVTVSPVGIIKLGIAAACSLYEIY